MIVCDKTNCKKKAEYILNIDYMGQKNMHRIDLCDDHYNEIEAQVKEDGSNAVVSLAEQLNAELAKQKPKSKKVG